MRTILILSFAVSMWGICTALQKVAVRHMPPTIVQFVGLLSAALVVAAYVLFAKVNISSSLNIRGVAFSAIAYSVSAIGSIAFLSLAREKDLTNILGITSCHTLVSFLIAVLFLGESFTLPKIIGIIITLIGVFISTK